jgi:chromosome segregation ATPase
MKTLLPVIIALGFLAVGCSPSSEQQARSDALEAELHIQREELNRLRSELDADRRRLYRSIVEIQSRVEDLDRNLNMARLEIWGDGSSTGARLSTARRTLAYIQAEVDSLAMELRTTSRGQ